MLLYKFVIDWYTYPGRSSLIQATTASRCRWGSTTATIMGLTPKSSDVRINAWSTVPISRYIILLSTVYDAVMARIYVWFASCKIGTLFKYMTFYTAPSSTLYSVCTCFSRLPNFIWDVIKSHCKYLHAPLSVARFGSVSNIEDPHPYTCVGGSGYWEGRP